MSKYCYFKIITAIKIELLCFIKRFTEDNGTDMKCSYPKTKQKQTKEKERKREEKEKMCTASQRTSTVYN